MADSLKFGTSGLRGLASDLTALVVARYALAFVEHLRATGGLGGAREVLVGRDLRESSPGIAAAVMGGIASAGLNPRDCGELPTPALALAAMTRELPAIMVTGSHIPADRNGLKFYGPAGEITKEDEAGIVVALPQVQQAPSTSAEAEPMPEALEEYVARCRLLLRDGALSGKRIGVWQHSSVFRDGLVELLRGLGAEVIPLGRSETFVPIDTEAVSADYAAQIAAWVREHGLAALISTDGDADRPLVGGETGEVIRGDVLGALTARYLGIEAVVTPITSTAALEASGWFRPVIRTRVGSPYVLAGMEQARLGGGPVLGFEANGGALLGAPVRLNYKEIPALPTRDAMLPILGVLGLAQQTGLPLSQLVATLPARFARSGRLENVPPERSEALLNELSEEFFAEVGTVSDVGDLDGSRVVFESGDVIHYRPSGNAPELRCYTEADTAERADWLLNWGLAAAERVVR